MVEWVALNRVVFSRRFSIDCKMVESQLHWLSNLELWVNSNRRNYQELLIIERPDPSGFWRHRSIFQEYVFKWCITFSAHDNLTFTSLEAFKTLRQKKYLSPEGTCILCCKRLLQLQATDFWSKGYMCDWFDTQMGKFKQLGLNFRPIRWQNVNDY